MTCNLCFTPDCYPYAHLGLNLCVACIDELSELSCTKNEASSLEWNSVSGSHTATVDSLFWYSGIIRTLTIGAKVKGDMSALNRLLHIWAAEVEGKFIFEKFDAVMPCPSSLWSRLHGRIDIAWFLAAKLAGMYRLKFIRPPRKIYWNLKKRSQTSRPIDSNLVVPESIVGHKEIFEAKGHCLIVDDVVTTGMTLRTCMEHAAALNLGRFSSLTFARAR